MRITLFLLALFAVAITAASEMDIGNKEVEYIVTDVTDVSEIEDFFWFSRPAFNSKQVNCINGKAKTDKAVSAALTECRKKFAYLMAGRGADCVKAIPLLKSYL
jgi:hypothetical protein